MFTVNNELNLFINDIDIFQNISCLRLIRESIQLFTYLFKFQNISCLRLISNAPNILSHLRVFQNISCLRLILLTVYTQIITSNFKTFHVYG